MTSVTLKAHFDGQHIVLDEPFDIPANAALAVTVFAPSACDPDNEDQDWIEFSMQNLARAYGDDEPDYTLADIKS